MNAEVDGGPAFPCQYVYEMSGISIRDWFAGVAVTGLINHRDYSAVFGDRNDLKMIAHIAYSIADAMLEERKRNR